MMAISDGAEATVDAAFADLRAALPEGAAIMRVSADPSSDGKWAALVEVHRFHVNASAFPGFHVQTEDLGLHDTPEAAIAAAVRDVTRQLRAPEPDDAWFEDELAWGERHGD